MSTYELKRADPTWDVTFNGVLLGQITLIWHDTFKVTTHEGGNLGVSDTLFMAKQKLIDWNEGRNG